MNYQMSCLFFESQTWTNVLLRSVFSSSNKLYCCRYVSKWSSYCQGARVIIPLFHVVVRTGEYYYNARACPRLKAMNLSSVTQPFGCMEFFVIGSLTFDKHWHYWVRASTYERRTRGLEKQTPMHVIVSVRPLKSPTCSKYLRPCFALQSLLLQRVAVHPIWPSFTYWDCFPWLDRGPEARPCCRPPSLPWKISTPTLTYSPDMRSSWFLRIPRWGCRLCHTIIMFI